MRETIKAACCVGGCSYKKDFSIIYYYFPTRGTKKEVIKKKEL